MLKRKHLAKVMTAVFVGSCFVAACDEGVPSGKKNDQSDGERIALGDSSPPPSVASEIVEDSKVPRPDMSVLAAKVQVGDVILIGGDSIFLQAGVAFSKHRPAYGHVGIVVATEPSVRVLEASGSPVDDGTVEESDLAHFARDADWLAVMRPEHHADEFVSSAQAAAKRATGFDSSYDLSTPDELYCTELIDVAMADGNWSVPLDRQMMMDKPIILPEAVLFHPDFTKVLVLPATES